MAFGRKSKKVVIVELGSVRPFSDIAGRNTVRLDDSPEKKMALALRLQTIGCAVKMDGETWLQVKFGKELILPSDNAAPKGTADKKLHHNVNWIRGDPNPQCAICQAKDGKEIPLMKRPDTYFCRVCGTNFGKPQPPPEFGIPKIDWPPDRQSPTTGRDDDDESEFIKARR